MHTKSLNPVLLCLVPYFLQLISPTHCAVRLIPNCAFEDTVNLTASIKHTNNSYSYEDVLIPSTLIGYYDYIERYGGERIPVELHVRGCVCRLKRCVRFCCHPRADMYRNYYNSMECDKMLNKELNYSPLVNVTQHNGRKVLTDVVKGFAVQTGIACEPGYMLKPHAYLDEQWELLENGTLRRVHNGLVYSRRDYCLSAYPVGDKYVLNPLVCSTKVVESEKISMVMRNTIIMLVSMPFLYATILIYSLFLDLRNLHTKCIVSYLVSLAIGSTMIIAVNMGDVNHNRAICASLGFIAYYFLSAVFFWLNVISFDIWQNFRGTKGNIQHLHERTRFLYYSLYAWGMPVVMTIITAGLQYSNIPPGLKSGIGVTHCWLKDDDWSAMMYFYGPCLLLSVLNMIIFYLTVRRIYRIRKELQILSKNEDRISRLRTQQNNMWLFFRLFIIMGINWTLELICYLVDDETDYDILFTIIEIYNSIQGLIIFILLVMKKKVLLLIKKALMEIPAKFGKR